MFQKDLYYDPQYHIKDLQDGYIIMLDLKGMNKDRINIEIEDYSLTISGEYFEQTDKGYPSGSYLSQQFGTFLKTLPLSKNANAPKVTSQMEGDTLTIHIPKL